MGKRKPLKTIGTTLVVSALKYIQNLFSFVTKQVRPESSTVTLFSICEISAGFIYRFFCISVLPLEVQLSDRNPIKTGLNPPHLCACPKPGTGIPRSYVIVFICVQWFEMRCSCLFVDKLAKRAIYDWSMVKLKQ